jgi:tetratricopeptide (TPR) repeat protein
VHDAWTSYESVGFASDIAPITMPADAQVVKAYTTSVESFVNSQISTQEATLLADINKSADPTKSTNRLGVLYARNGLFDKAEVQFNKLAAKEYVPALINLGNIYYSWRKDPVKALGFYTRAQKKDATAVGAWLGIARVNNDQENYGAARDAFNQVRQLSPDLATQFAYLDLRGDESARAADISGAKSVLVWEDSK